MIDGEIGVTRGGCYTAELNTKYRMSDPDSIPDATLTLTFTVINSKLVPSKNIREVEKIKKSTNSRTK